MALACDVAKSNLVEVVTVADVDAEKHFDDSLVQIRKQGLVKIMKLNLVRDSEARFGQDFEV